MQAYSPPPSLWKLVEQYVCPQQNEEVKCLLGLSLVEQSLDLHGEVEMLLDIWREMKDEDENSATLRRGLPEPPNIRERLIQEIVFFVDNVKEKAVRKGIDPEQILRQHNTSVLDYAQEQSRPGSSAGYSSRNSDGRQTPMMVMSPERLNSANELQDGIEAVNAQLNYLDFDQVCENLRKTLEEEVCQLLEDIQFLQGCLDSQADVRDCITPRISREPTLTELKVERSQLEKSLLSSDVVAPILPITKPNFISSHRVLPATPPSPRSSSPTLLSRSAPLKANHNLGRPNVPFVGLHLSEGDSLTSQTHQTKLFQQKNHTDHDGMNDIGARASKSDGDTSIKISPIVTGTIIGSNPKVPLPTPPAISRDKSGSATIVRRRTASPGRVRVVDVTSIVDQNILVKTCVVTSSTQSPPLSVNTVTAETLVSPNSTSGLQRPSSANRFRKMVHGYRDHDGD